MKTREEIEKEKEDVKGRIELLKLSISTSFNLDQIVEIRIAIAQATGELSTLNWILGEKPF